MMTGRESAGAPFDEQAALEELERLQRAIEESRRQRGQTVEEFDAFVRSFKNPAPDRDTPPVPRPAPIPRRFPSRTCAAPAAAPTPPCLRPRQPAPLPEITDSARPGAAAASRAAADRRVGAGCSASGKRLGFPTLIAGLAAIAVIVVAAVFLLNRRGAPDAAPRLRLRSTSPSRRPRHRAAPPSATTRDPTGPSRRRAPDAES